MKTLVIAALAFLLAGVVPIVAQEQPIALDTKTTIDDQEFFRWLVSNSPLKNTWKNVGGQNSGEFTLAFEEKGGKLRAFFKDMRSTPYFNPNGEVRNPTVNNGRVRFEAPYGGEDFEYTFDGKKLVGTSKGRIPMGDWVSATLRGKEFHRSHIATPLTEK